MLGMLGVGSSRPKDAREYHVAAYDARDVPSQIIAHVMTDPLDAEVLWCPVDAILPHGRTDRADAHAVQIWGSCITCLLPHIRVDPANADDVGASMSHFAATQLMLMMLGCALRATALHVGAYPADAHNAQAPREYVRADPADAVYAQARMNQLSGRPRSFSFWVRTHFRRLWGGPR